MIVLDTSALMAVILDEPAAEACMRRIEQADEIVISAATLAECLIVAERRGVGAVMERLVEGIGARIEAVTPAMAHHVAAAYGRWGKGAHPAGLNFGDCFAYALAQDLASPLLYVGDDFARTDLRTA